MQYEKEINPRTGQPYYANNRQEIVNCLRSMKLDDSEGGILSNKNVVDRIYYFMDLAETEIDAQLEQYYFTPLCECNQVMPNGNIVKSFPPALRNLAVKLACALLAQAEFQQNDPNRNDAVRDLLNQSHDELYRLSLFNHKLPGQRYKSAVSKTMPPTMQPGRDPERLTL